MRSKGILMFAIAGVLMGSVTGCSKEEAAAAKNEISQTAQESDSQKKEHSDAGAEGKTEVKGTTEAEGTEQQNDGEGQENTAATENGQEQSGSSVLLKAAEDIRYNFQNVSVHDPSVVKYEDTYYIFGSHLAAAKSTDLMNWTLIGSGVNKTNPIIPDAMNEMPEAFSWSQSDTFWAPDVIQLADGRFYMYYCNCEGSCPLSCLGVAVADQIEGPYEDLGIILKSGMGAEELSEDGDVYDATVQPNVVDPCVFFDAEGRLFMVYGSYSGGIFILEMNPETGMPLTSGYGKKILGGNHLRIEGPYIMYSPETEYYYLFLSYGGLASDGGYNIRVCRSKNPDGPYYDTEGNDMINCKGAAGTAFDDGAAAKFGAKLMGNYAFTYREGENGKMRLGYVSPGHNSAIYEEETGQYFLIYHTRFEARGEGHEVRVHQMFMNEDGWPVIAPYRYTEETIGTYTEDQIVGEYKIINHMKDISAEIRYSEDIILNPDHTITGAYKGTWELKDDHTALITLGTTTYTGVFLKQWDEDGLKNVMTFSALSPYGMSIWGSGYTPME